MIFVYASYVIGLGLLLLLLKWAVRQKRYLQKQIQNIHDA